MKKKTFGRIAALGLAGLTAVPAISIVASAADVKVDDLTKTISGTAYRIMLSDVCRTTRTSYATYVETTNTVTFNDDYGSVPETDSAIVLTGLDQKYVDVNGKYYTTEAQANSIVNGLTNAVTANNSKQTNDILNAWKNQWRDYVYAQQQIKLNADWEGGKNPTTGNTVSPSVARPTDVEKSWYVYTCDAKKEAKTMKQIADEVGANVTITAGVIESAAEGATNVYKVNTNGTTSTTTPGPISGVYATPADAINVYSTAVYNDASYFDGVYYWPNRDAMYYYYGYTPSTSIRTISSGYTLTANSRYFDYTRNTYHATNDAYLNRGYITNLGTNYYTNESGVYSNSATGLYYLSYSAAVSANRSGTVKWERSLSTTAGYFSMKTGGYYSTYALAYSASGNVASYVIAVNGASNTSTGLDYLDPYYYYFMGNRYQNTSNDTSSVKIGNRTGWNAVASSAKSAKSGATLNVTMNGETVIPSTVVSSIQGRNVTVNFTLKNGVVYSINGNDVSSAKNIDIDTIYNTKNVPSKLVSKAKSKNNGVSTSQLTIDSGSFGSSADVTVKFATKRAGCTARLYRYNSDRNSLSLVDKSTVNSSGKCTFDGVTKGGDYVIVLS